HSLAVKLRPRFYPSHANLKSFFILNREPRLRSVPGGRGQVCAMRLNEANVEFLSGYFSTHGRRKKTEAAYRSDLAQFNAFAGEDFSLGSLDSSIIERWAAHLRGEKYSPASIRRKIV